MVSFVDDESATNGMDAESNSVSMAHGRRVALVPPWVVRGTRYIATLGDLAASSTLGDLCTFGHVAMPISALGG